MWIRWESVLEHAAEIVRSYDTPVTLRQLFYRLVADGTLVNKFTSYQQLAAKSAAARRSDGFPDLADNTRSIDRSVSFEGPEEARDWLRETYRRDRTEGQPQGVYLVVEKSTLVAQMRSWFGDRGLPVVALRGYSSQALVDEVRREADGDAVFLYVGDHDPTGEDIERDFAARVGADLVRVAVLPEHIERYSLPPAPGKSTDPRAAGFTVRHGELVQVEVEALDPDDLRQLVTDAIEPYWDEDAYRAVLAVEAEERETL